MATHRSLACEPAADDSFGPVVDACARSFDFTLLFEQSILSAAPTTVFLLLSLWRIWKLRISSHKTKHSWMSIVKPIAALALIVCQITLLALYTRSNTIKTRFSISTTVLSLSAAMAILPLSYLEHTRSVRPSTLLTSYLAFSIMLEVPQIRTIYLIPGQLDLAAAFSTVMVVKAALLLFESWNKRVLLESQYCSLATEATSGIFSRSLFLWMNSLFLKGFARVISFDDLGPVDSKLDSARLHQVFCAEWELQDHNVKWPLLRTSWRALRWSILSPVPPRLCYGGFLFAQPFLINRATAYLSSSSGTIDDDIGYGLIAAAGFVYLGIAVSTALYKHQLYRHITIVRGSLVSVIYSQSLSMKRLPDDPSAAVTLMSTDVDRICQSLVCLHDTWSRPLELIVGVSLLTLQIGWVSVVPLIVVLFSALVDSKVTLSIGGRVALWTDAVQQRISLTANVLSSMKSVKMLGLVRPMHVMLQNERLRELRLQSKFRWSTLWLNTLGNVPTALTAAVTFMTYAIKAHLQGSTNLDASQAFTSLALISLVTTPASELLTAFPFTAACLGCLRRIQEYLMQPRYTDRRVFTTGMDGSFAEKANRVSNSDTIIARIFHISIPALVGSGSLIQDLDVTIHRNTLTMILGPSGSGKSTLLKAILGEVNYSGSISIATTRIAYCPQSPWLFTGTVQQNICGLGVERIDNIWYQSVLYASALHDDLLTLPLGDQTRIEGQAASLSGGQKQRIALARALYQQPRLLLLDDILSTLDLQTETQIIKNLLDPNGLLRNSKTAIVLVTHTRRYEPLADNVIIFDESGNSTQCSHISPLEDRIVSMISEKPETLVLPTDAATSKQDLCSNKVVQEDHSSAVSLQLDGDTADYFYYFRTMKWQQVLFFFLLVAIQTVCYYMSQVVLQWWTADHGLEETKWMSIYIILAVGNAVFYGCIVWAMFLNIVPESAAKLHKVLLDTVMDAPYSFLAKTDAGIILNRFSQDMTLIESQLPTGIMCTTIYLFWTIGSLALISTGSVWMALTIPAVFIAVFFLQRVYLRTSRRLRLIELELRSPTYSHFMETLKGLLCIRTLDWEKQFTNAMIAKLDASQVPFYLLYCAQRWLQLVLDLIVAALAIVVMTLAVKLRSSTDPGSLGLSLNNILSFNETLSLLLQFWTQLEVSLGAITRTREFSKEVPRESNPPFPSQPSPEWPDRGGIEIRNLKVQYTEAKVALSNINMSIRPGEKIALCGRAGSGKTSLLSAILRLLEPSHGCILIDGIDISSVSHETVRGRLLTIPQDPFLLQRNSRFNLDPLSHYSDAQVVAVLSKVSIWPLLEKRGGLDASISSDHLSHGQKQLFSLARAILRKDVTEIGGEKESRGRVLLLDGATSSVDADTHALMQRIVKDEFPTHTMLIVEHRLDTILDCDRVAVLDAGRLVDFDSPATLLSRDSAFSALYNAREREAL